MRTPDVLGGTPRVAGTRLSVSAIAELWNKGETLANLLDMFPGLTAAGVYSAVAYYWDHKAEVDQEIEENDPENWIKDPSGRWRLRAPEERIGR